MLCSGKVSQPRFVCVCVRDISYKLIHACISAAQDDLTMSKRNITHSRIHQSIGEQGPQCDKTREQESKFFEEHLKSEQSQLDL